MLNIKQNEGLLSILYTIDEGLPVMFFHIMDNKSKLIIMKENGEHSHRH